MRFLLIIGILTAGGYFGYHEGRSRIEKKAADGLVLLESRTKELASVMTQALRAESAMNGEEALAALNRFAHSSGQIGGMPAVQFWDKVYLAGSVETVKDGSYQLKKQLFQAGPTYWVSRDSYTVVWSPKFSDNFRIGHINAATSLHGSGIPSNETLDELMELMRQEGKLGDFVFYYGKPCVMDIFINWVYDDKNKNWFLDPGPSGGLKAAYRPQQRL
ncbi:MAG: hypothetical protein HY747_04095 [Elusimicrobia bacterium]|nr:hypothetical protein [Elusimicrobiota bacterium]